MSAARVSRGVLAAAALLLCSCTGSGAAPNAPTLAAPSATGLAEPTATPSAAKTVAASEVWGDSEGARLAASYTKAFNDYDGTIDDDVKRAARGTKSLAEGGQPVDPRLASALWECFARFRPSKATSVLLVKDLQAAVLAVKDPSYGPKAVLKLSARISDPKDPAQGLDELQYWQATAARLIGELRYAPGVKPLVKALLTQNKRDLSFAVRLALTKMPKEAEPVLIAALNGGDAELNALANGYPRKGHVPHLADALAAISRPAGQQAILTALQSADNEENRALLAMMLPRFPSTPAALKAFFAAYGNIDPNTTLPLMGGANARAILAQSVATFFDPSLTEWLLRETAAAKGDAADAMLPAALPSAIKLMPNKSSKAVGDAVAKIPGQAIEKDMYRSALAVLDSCKKEAACYVRFLDTPVAASPPSAKMGHVKAAWMAGIYGDATTRTALVATVAKVKDPSVRVAMLDAITHLAPQGDVASAAALEAVVESDRAVGAVAGGDEIFKVALALRARVP